MYCQLEYLANRPLVHLEHALDELPATLDETYERTLREIDDTNSEYAPRLLLCVAVASRPLRVEELAEILAFDFKGLIPAFREECRLKNPVEAVLSTCSTLLSVVEDQYSQVVQFAHFSVKEFLTSTRFAEKRDSISSHYYISMTPAHTVITQACLGMLLHLEQNVTQNFLTRFPLAKYAARHWFEHARFEDVSQNVEAGMKQLFDRTKPYLSIWLGIHDPTKSGPFPPRGTPLHYAAFCGLHDIAKILATEYPEDVNSQSFDDALTPLHLTLKEKFMDVAWMLIEHGANVSAQDKDGSTPLHWASIGGHVDVARMLVERGANMSTQDKGGKTALHWAIINGHVDLARMLAELGAEVSAQDKNGWTPLHWAFNGGRVDVIRVLVECGADGSVPDKHGWTPLLWAFSKGYVDVAQMFVERGTNMSVQDEYGRTPLHWASSRGYVNVALALVDHGADGSAQDKEGRTALHWASSGGHADVVRILTDSGANGSAQDKDGRTSLHWASIEGHVDVARILVKHGADVSVQDEYGRTPLHWAFSKGHVEVAQILLEGGANGSTQDKDGRTRLHWASIGGHVDVARMLMETGTNVSVQDKDGRTPLHWASSEGHVDVVQMLMETGARSVQDKDGRTPLHWASIGGHVDVARILMEHGANMSTQDKGGRTPLHWASIGGHVDVAQMLVERGADMSVRTQDGRTPLQLASSKGHVDVVQILVGREDPLHQTPTYAPSLSLPPSNPLPVSTSPSQSSARLASMRTTRVTLPDEPKELPGGVDDELPYSDDESRGMLVLPDEQRHAGPVETPCSATNSPNLIIDFTESEPQGGSTNGVIRGYYDRCCCHQ